ncbi:MAG TPA: tRNA lysidine(34) synthetase TilS [Solirubrobacterales bacterium]|nr:tRNA lysidine(34) synthetase TilS [Solirubrobacterales bacterium]
MEKAAALDELRELVAASGLIDPGSSVVVMTSGGPDSACAAAAVARLLGAEPVHALHVNYALRGGAGESEAACRRLCAALRLDLHIERSDPALLEGRNLQAAAREIRYDAAERLRVRTGADLVVTGHTLTDLAETVLYRLAASPGTRSLLGLPPRSGRVVRPLLAIDRDRARELAAGAGLAFADDETNDDPTFARNRIRARVLPELRELSAAAERNIAATRAELAEEAELLDRVVLEALDSAGAGAGAIAVRAAELDRWEPALRRLALRALAERAAGRPVPIGSARTAEILDLAARPGGGEIDLGRGLTAACEAGFVRFRASAAEAAPEPVALRLPGRARVGRWEIRAELHPSPVEPAGPELATLDARALAGPVEVRTWREGDRIRPLGMAGTKTLGDLFTDRRVPRSLRHDLPVITVGGEVAWVAGVAVSEDFRIDDRTEEVAVLTARVLDP